MTTPLDGPAPEAPEPAADVPVHDDGDVRPTGRSTGRMRQTVGDMIRSMAVVLAVVFVIVLLAWRPLPEAVKVVDTAPAIAEATAAATPTAYTSSNASLW